MTTEDLREAAGRAAMQTVAAGALDYPEFLLQTMPKDPNDPEVSERIEEVARLSVKLNVLDRANMREKIFKYNKGIPRGPARLLFDNALKKADDEAQSNAASERGAAADRKRQSKDVGEMRGHVFVKDGCIWRKSAVGAEERVSNFSFIPTHRVAKDDSVDDWIRCRIEKPYEGLDAGLPGAPATMVVDKEFLIPPNAMASRHALKLILPNGCATTMSDDDLQGLKESFTRDFDLPSLPRLQSTTILGRHTMPDGSVRFIVPCGTIGSDGQWMETGDLTYVHGHGTSAILTSKMPGKRDVRPELDSPALRATAKAAFETVLLLNRVEDMAAMVGWHFATLIAPSLREKAGIIAGAPILNIVGSASAGKSSLAGRVLWPMFAGVKANGELMSWKGTKFTMAKEFATANALAACWDENREGSSLGQAAIRKEFYDTLRGSYTKEIVSRGNQDKSVTLYPLAILSNVNGEGRIEGDQALVERVVFVVLDGNYLQEHPECVVAYKKIVELDLASLGPFLQAWSVKVNVDSVLAEASGLVETALTRLGRAGGKLHARAVSNLVWISCGIVMFNRLAEELGATTPKVGYVATVDRMIRAMFEEEEGVDLRGHEGRVRSNFDTALIEWSAMAAEEELVEGRHFVWVDGADGLRLCLRLSLIMGQWDEWRMGRGRGLPPLGKGDLARKAREMVKAGGSYVTRADKESRAPFDDGRKHCIEIDWSKVPASLDCDEFPRNELKTHGGARRGQQEDAADLFARFKNAGKPS